MKNNGGNSMRLVKCLIITISLVVVGCSTTTTRLHPTLDQELKLIDSVVIIPPRIAIELVTFTGENERMSEREQEFGQTISSKARDELVLKGYNVVDYDIGDQMQGNEDFAYVISQIQDNFDQASKDLNLGKPLSQEKASSLKGSVGDVVNVVAEQAGADALLLIRYNGFDKSGGQVAKDIGTSVLVAVLTMGSVVPVQQKSGAVIQAALIDTTTGEVLWADTSAGILSPNIVDTVMNSMPSDVDAPVEVAPAPSEPTEPSHVSELTLDGAGAQ
jgi:hypothetical protein